MGSTMSRSVVGCFTPTAHANNHHSSSQQVLHGEPLDEGLGHSFCYIRPSSASAAALTSSSPPHSDIDILSSDSFSGSLHQRNASDSTFKTLSETSFKTISGASVSANTSTPRTITSREQFANVPDDSRAAAFEGTASFNSLPLQPVPRGLSQSGPITSGSQAGYGPLDRGYLSGPIERGFMSGPIERGFLSGPLERGCVSAPMEPSDRSLFSAPLSASAYLRRRKRSLAQLVRNIGQPVRKAISRSLSKTTVSFLTTPVKQLLSSRNDSAKEARAGLDCNSDSGYSSDSSDDSHNLQWAQGKAGEDRVHIVLSEEHGWLFVGIYDGFNGPDAPDFLLSNLYNEVYKQLRGLLWDRNPTNSIDNSQAQEYCTVDSFCSESLHDEDHAQCSYDDSLSRTLSPNRGSLCKSSSYNSSKVAGSNQQQLTTTTNESLGVCKRNSSPLSLKGTNSSCKHVKSSRSVKSLFEFKLRKSHGDSKEENSKARNQSLQLEQEAGGRVKNNVLKPTLAVDKTCKSGVTDHSAVLKALAAALESTENAYLEMADLSMQEIPELALMGSCVLVMLMKGEDVYVMNVGDSRAILATAKTDPKTCTSNTRGLVSLQASDSERIGARDSQLRQELERIMEESPADSETFESSHTCSSSGPPPTSILLNALQLSTDHSTTVEEEVLRIRMEHPDDNQSISNDRVKGRLKVTRAFGAGFLKMPRWNNALLEMFRVEYVGASPYLSCVPALHHHSLGPNDRFLVLSSDGLYQYLSNEEVVSQVEWFMENYPDGDPAQYLIEELLFRAAKKAGMDFHELLDIPQGDRRKYHDDVSVMVISFEGRIWRSFG